MGNLRSINLISKLVLLVKKKVHKPFSLNTINKFKYQLETLILFLALVKISHFSKNIRLV